MNTPRLHRVQAASVRTALVATAIVAVVYAAVAVAVMLIVTRDLTGEIDTRLTGALDRIATDQRLGDRVFRTPTEGPRFGPPLLVWVVAGDGTVTGNDPNATLPAADAAATTSPRTVSIGGTDVRIAGRTAAAGRVVVGQSTDSVSRARSTVVLAEVIVGPLLLAAVFLGAFAIGRRVAAPIELARIRQMEFTADASHELRTPLAVIEAQSSLALAQPREAPWYRAAFERVDHESRRIRRLVDDMLWLARFDASARTPGAEPVDLAVLAAQAADRFAVVAETRGLTLRVRTEPGTLVVAAPPDWLDRLLGALLDNACKYSPEGGTVEVSVRPEGARVRLGVDDSGPGIPADQRTRIFDRFHRATSEAGGAGLGLAIADAIVRATAGRWEVGDSPLGGAAMAVTWPRGLPAVRGAASSDQPPAPAPQRART